MRYDVILIDGPYLAHRSYTAPYKLSHNEQDSTMIHGFFNSLLSMKKKQNPRTFAVAWESYNTKSWRKELSPSYKPSKPINKSFLQQLNDIKLLLDALHIKQFYAPNNEADDVIATLTHKTNKSVLIFTVDKDIMQLTSDEQQIHILCANRILDEEKVKEKFNVNPCQIPDYLALVGDPSDSIDGIKGIGKKKAASMLSDDNLLCLMSSSDFKSKDDLNKALFNRRLTLLNYDANIQLVFPRPTATNPIDILNKYNLQQLKERLPELLSLRGDKK